MKLSIAKTIKFLGFTSFVTLMVACGSSAPKENAVKNFLVGVNRPNNLFVADVDKRKVIQSCEVPGRFGLGTVVLAPDKDIAYVLANGSEDVYGIQLDTCDVVFSAIQSQGDVRAKSIGSVTISRDGSEIYTVQNRTQMLPDQLKVLPPKFVVYRTADGMNAKPVRSFDVPRVIFTLDVGKDGTVYAHGPDLLSINPENGEIKTVLEGRSSQQPLQTPPDGVTAWNNGRATDEFIKAYTTVKFADDSYDMATAVPMWGYMKVDLTTGEASREEFGVYQAPIFSGLTSPVNRNHYYGVLNQLMKYDVEKKALIKIVDLDHAYYCLVFSPQGDRIYLGGTLNNIAIYDPDTLEKVGNIKLPGGDMGMSSFQVFTKS